MNGVEIDFLSCGIASNLAGGSDDETNCLMFKNIWAFDEVSLREALVEALLPSPPSSLRTLKLLYNKSNRGRGEFRGIAFATFGSVADTRRVVNALRASGSQLRGHTVEYSFAKSHSEGEMMRNFVHGMPPLGILPETVDLQEQMLAQAESVENMEQSVNSGMWQEYMKKFAPKEPARIVSRSTAGGDEEKTKGTTEEKGASTQTYNQMRIAELEFLHSGL